MPPRKRKSAVANGSVAEPSPKRPRKPIAETAATSRPKRASRTAEIIPVKTRTNATKAKGVRGRKPGTKVAVPLAEAVTPRKRGRPPLNSTIAKTKSTATTPKAKPDVAKAGPKLSNIIQGKPKRPVGTPPKKRRTFFASKNTQTAPLSDGAGQDLDEEPDLTIENPEDDAYGVDGRSYWLMKAEPESRIVKGVDVKFSIEDLRAAKAPEPWDGVRNPVARNNMRAMKEGDYAFFYHSSCKVPGIVGLMEIVREHSVDETAFDPKHPYYDEKSTRDKAKWEVVHVEFRRKFDDVLTLETLKSHAKPGQPLENMQTLRQSRVSVSRVTPGEWTFIMSLLGESEPGPVAAVEKSAEESAKVNGEQQQAKELPENENIVDTPSGSAKATANAQVTAESLPGPIDGADKS